jgi:hypothetical protein
MAVVLVHQGPTLTQEKYEQIVDKLTDGGGLDSLSDWPVAGIISHAAGESPSGFRVVDIWESEEAASAFGEQLGPILAEVGVEDAPELYEAHTIVVS